MKGLAYWIGLETKTSYEFFRDAILPGLIPEHVIEMLRDTFADDMGLCAECHMDCHYHPIAPDGSKFCTILLHDAVKPTWRLQDVL